MKIPAIEVKTRSRGFAKVHSDENVTVDHEELQAAEFSGRKLKTLTVIGSRLTACKFEKMRIEGCALGAGKEVSEYIGCSFDGSDMRMGVGGYARFESCSFQNTRVEDWFCFAVEMVDCSFSGRMVGSFFNGRPRDDQQSAVKRKRNDFYGNDFSKMKLEDVAFRTGIDLERQKLPTGAEYIYLRDAETAVRNARAEILEWKDLELRKLSMSWIKTMDEEIQNGQRQMLLRADDYPKSMRQSTAAVLEILRKYAEPQPAT